MEDGERWKRDRGTQKGMGRKEKELEKWEERVKGRKRGKGGRWKGGSDVSSVKLV